MSKMSNIDPTLLVQKIHVKPDCFKFNHPSLICISGQSQSGKSFWLRELVKFRETMFNVKFSRIIYCSPHNYPFSNSIFHELKDVVIEFHTGLPNLHKLQLEHNSQPCLILVDDLMTSVLNSQHLVDFATTFIHHHSITLAVSFQHYYTPSKFGKVFIRNSHYRVFFYNRLDQRELSLISSQITNNSKFFGESFKFLLDRYPNQPSYYLLIDGHHRSQTPAEFWCRTNIFPKNFEEDPTPIVFFLNPNYKSS